MINGALFIFAGIRIRTHNSLLFLFLVFQASCSEREQDIENVDSEDVSIQVDEVPLRYCIAEDAY